MPPTWPRRDRRAARRGCPRAGPVPAGVDADDRVRRDGLAAAEEVDASADERRRGVVGRHRERGDPAEPLRAAEQDLARRRAADEAAEREHPSARQRDRREARDRLRQRADPLDVNRRRRSRGLRRGAPDEGGRGQQVEPVGLAQVARPGAGDARVPVLPHDPPRLRVDHDHAVVVVIVGGDQPVRPAHGERGLGEPGRSARRAEGPGHGAATVHDHDPAGGGEARDQHLAVGEQLRVGGVGHRRADRPEQATRGSEPVDPASDLGHQQPAVRERRVAVRAREPARRVVGAAAAEHAPHALARSTWTMRQFWMSATVVIPERSR